MPQNKFFKAICLILTLLPLTSVALPTADLSRFVDKETTTLDTATGLEWLDVPQSQSLSYYAVIDKTKPGGEFSGYRYAKFEELLSLIDFFFPEPNEVAPELKAQVTGLFGRTNSTEHKDSYLYVTTGMVDPEDLLEQEVANVPIYTFSAARYRANSGGGWGPVSGTFGPEESNKWVGSFLVRKSPDHHVVPEIDITPAPMALALLLLTALAGWERRKRG
jgi:hypothetical protein